MARGGRGAAIRATWPTVRFLPCGSGRQGATAAGGRVSCGGRWGEPRCRMLLLIQLPSATDWQESSGQRAAAPAHLPRSNCCQCHCLFVIVPAPIFFKVPPMTIRWVCSCTRRLPDIDCSRFVRPTVVVCHCLTQGPFASYLEIRPALA